MSNERKRAGLGAKGGVFLVLVLIALLVLKSMAVVVPAGARGVLFDRFRGGVQREVVLGEGLSLVNPLATNVVLISVRQQTYTMSDEITEGQVRGADGIQAKSMDGQIVRVEASVRFQVAPERAADVYAQVGEGYVSQVLLPAIRSITQNTIGEYPVARIYSAEREAIARECSDKLRQEMEPQGLIIHEFLLRDVTFSPEYTSAIENKQIEQQSAQRKEFELRVAQEEAKRRRILAEGEAEANRIRGAALRVNPRVIQYEYLRKVAPNVEALVVDEATLRRGAIATPKP